jgi:hypothetical protein
MTTTSRNLRHTHTGAVKRARKAEKEVIRLRETLRTIENMIVRPVSMTDAESLLGSIERLAANTLKGHA